MSLRPTSHRATRATTAKDTRKTASVIPSNDCIVNASTKTGSRRSLLVCALDETFDLAFKTEARNASRVFQAGVFLDCSKCYERVPLAQLEQLAIESGFRLYALNCALNMYSGSRRILIQGAVSDAVQSTCGLPPGCGLAVDLLQWQ
eukprot:6475640-Amphidinium_carterae.1